MKLLSKINRCDIFVSLYCLYYLQGALYTPGIINKCLQFLMIFWGIILAYPYILNFKNIPTFLKVTVLLVLIYSIYGLILMLGEGYVIKEMNIGHVATYVYLQNSLRSLLPIFIFYNYACNGYLSEKRLISYSFILFLFVVVFYSYNHQKLAAQAIIQGTNSKEFTNNVGYSFLSLMPFAFLYIRKVLAYILIVSCYCFVIMSFKRGAILIGTISLVYFLYVKIKESGSLLDLFKKSILVFVLLFSLVTYISQTFDNSKYFQKRMEQTQQGNMSGRDQIYPRIWQAIEQDESVTHLLFGRGADSTIGIAGNYAHQDWLETACDTGLLGIIILLSFYITFGVTAIRLNIFSKKYSSLFTMLFIICLLKTVFSMSIQSMEVSETILIGYIIYYYNLEKNKC